MNAFVLRIAPSGVDRVPEALESNELIIGWAEAEGLLDSNLDWYQFRKIVHDEYYGDDQDFTRSGRAAGNLWRFIREMSEGDFVVVPYGSEFYVAQVTGPTRYDPSKIDDDTAYRRPVEWLNGKKTIARRLARAALQSRMKAYQTCVGADDIVPEIQEVINLATKGEVPVFETDLRIKLIQETQKEICSGRLDPYGFERLLASLLKSLGSNKVQIVPRNLDKGIDILADFSLAHTFKFTLGVQAKHYQPDPPVGAQEIDQLASGMEAEGVFFGWFVTSGTFSQEATDRKAEIEEKQGVKIELIDGEQVSALIIEAGLYKIIDLS